LVVNPRSKNCACGLQFLLKPKRSHQNTFKALSERLKALKYLKILREDHKMHISWLRLVSQKNGYQHCSVNF